MVAVALVHVMLKRGVQVGQACRVVDFDNITIERQIFPELIAIDISTRRAKPRRTPR
jgi:DNA-binding LacI/PurR family transcriptional regulator